MSARNVLNTEEVTRFTDALAARARHADVRAWAGRTARRWILKNHDRFDRIFRDAATGAICIDGAARAPLPNTGAAPHPAWLAKALADGNTVVRLRLGRELYRQVLLVIRYLDAVKAGDPDRPLDRISYDQARGAAVVWQAALRVGARLRAGEEVVFKADTGEEVVELTTPLALCEEGRRMSHCVGDYDDDVADGRAFIYSLRTPGGKSRATIQISPEGQLVQVYGPCNEPVPAKARPALTGFLKAGGFVLPNTFPELPELDAAYQANFGDVEATLLSPAGRALFARYRFIESEDAPEYKSFVNAIDDDFVWYVGADIRDELFRMLHPGECVLRVRRAANWWVYDRALPELRVAAPLLLLRLKRYGVFDAGQEREIAAIEDRIEAELFDLTRAPADRIYHLGRSEEVRALNRIGAPAQLVRRSRLDIRGFRQLRHLGLRQQMNRWKKAAGHRRLPPSEGHLAVRRLLDGEAGAYVI